MSFPFYFTSRPLLLPLTYLEFSLIHGRCGDNSAKGTHANRALYREEDTVPRGGVKKNQEN